MFVETASYHNISETHDSVLTGNYKPQD